MSEQIIQEWFSSWYYPQWDKFDDIFEKDVYYSESWGPEYTGIQEIKQWFINWHKHHKLEKWDINQFWHMGYTTVVEWTFACTDQKGLNLFAGVSIIQFSENHKIQNLKEYASVLPKYNPLHQ